MKRLLLITDPIGGPTSVQHEIVSSLASGLRSRYELTVFTPFCDRDRASALADEGCRLITPPPAGFSFDRFLRGGERRNESMLWATSWIREALFRRNSTDAETVLKGLPVDYTVNLSMTVPARSDLWWILGTPLDQSIHGMASFNLIARMVDSAASGMVARMDSTVLHRIRSRSLRLLANSPYIQGLYRDRGFPVEGVVYTLKDLSGFRPTSEHPSRDYVLLYVGKELDSLDFQALARAGVRIVGFGNKVPAGTRMRKFVQSIEWLGPVSQSQLIDLYANALFTLFPFTCEPMGLVPIESMACGTPVLTYARQGPASTVLPGSTGWLVQGPDEMLAKATEIWSRRDSGISPARCVRRARDFIGQRMVDELVNWIEGFCSIDDKTRALDPRNWEGRRGKLAVMGSS